MQKETGMLYFILSMRGKFSITGGRYESIRKNNIHGKKSTEDFLQPVRKIHEENGIVREGIFSAEVSFGYFSKKDGIRQEFDLCEECYDRMIRQFKIPVTVQEETELC